MARLLSRFATPKAVIEYVDRSAPARVLPRHTSSVPGQVVTSEVRYRARNAAESQPPYAWSLLDDG